MMIEKKFNWKIWFFIVFFAVILLLASRATYMLLTGQVVDENDTPLPPVLIGVMVFMIVLVCSTYAATLFTLLKQVIVYQNTAFVLDHMGIHNTLVVINVLAFVIVARVEYIPWSAVSYLSPEGDMLYIRVKRKEITASPIGRLLTAILGYHFCYSFTKEPLSETEREFVSFHCMSQSLHLKTESLL